MALIRVTCFECGDVEITSRDVTIVINDKLSQFCFRCPQCNFSQLQHANEQIVDILVAVGVVVRQLSLPKESLTVEPDLPALDDNALIEFHHALSSSDFWKELE